MTQVKVEELARKEKASSFVESVKEKKDLKQKAGLVKPPKMFQPVNRPCRAPIPKESLVGERSSRIPVMAIPADNPRELGHIEDPEARNGFKKGLFTVASKTMRDVNKQKKFEDSLNGSKYLNTYVDKKLYNRMMKYLDDDSKAVVCYGYHYLNVYFT